MNLKKTDTIGGSLLLPVTGLLILFFGCYLLYDRVFLSIETGETQQRVGVISLAQEIKRFWHAVITDGLMGLLVTLFGSLIFVVGVIDWRRQTKIR